VAKQLQLKLASAEVTGKRSFGFHLVPSLQFRHCIRPAVICSQLGVDYESLADPNNRASCGGYYRVPLDVPGAPDDEKVNECRMEGCDFFF